MNIFRLSDCPVESAKLNQDLHVKKITLEACQMLANCYSPDILTIAPKTQEGNVRKYSHPNHPMSIYVRGSMGNFQWTISHAISLCEEFEYRFGKKHFCETFIRWADKNIPNNLISYENREHIFPQCFEKYPECKRDVPVEGYRVYYKTAKRSFIFKKKEVFATWTNRTIPDWF